MKNVILSFAFILLTIVGCKKKETMVVGNQSNNQDSLVLTQKFQVDSIKVSDSIKLNEKLTLSYERSVLVFPDIKEQSVLDSIYALTDLKIKDFSKAGLQKALEADMKNYFKTEGSDNDYMPDYPQTWDQKSEMYVHSNENNLLTVKYLYSGYTGGAHGFYNEMYKVFDIKNNKSILLSDIVKNPKDKIWNKLLMDSFSKNDTGAKEMLLEKVIPLNTNFFFDKNNLTFVYNQYEIAAYAAGVIYIKLNLEDIKDHLKPEFLQRIKS